MGMGNTFGFKPPPLSPGWEEFLLPAPVIERNRSGVSIAREELSLAGDRGANGTKARALWALACAAQKRGFRGICSAGGRISTQSLMICRIAQCLGMDFEYHCPRGSPTEMMEILIKAGFVIKQCHPGYSNQCRKMGRVAAEEREDWLFIDTGVEGPDMPEIVKRAAIQADLARFRRIVLPVGSGMTLSGIMRACEEIPEEDRPKILGIQIGGNPRTRLKRWAPSPWNRKVRLVDAKGSFYSNGDTRFGSAICDPTYSGKCIPFFNKTGDLFWNSGCRQIAMMEHQ